MSADHPVTFQQVLEVFEAWSTSGESRSPEIVWLDLKEELESLDAIYGPDVLSVLPAKAPRRKGSPLAWFEATPASKRQLNTDAVLHLELKTRLLAPLEDQELSLILSVPSAYPGSRPPQLQIKERYLGSLKVDDAIFSKVLRAFMHTSLHEDELSDASSESSVEGGPPRVKRKKIRFHALAAGAAEDGPEDRLEFMPGTPCLFDGVEWARSAVTRWLEAELNSLATKEVERQEEHRANELEMQDELLARQLQRQDLAVERGDDLEEQLIPSKVHDIASSEPLVDRKSVFVGHVARCSSVQEAFEVLAQLKSDKKIARASHNIWAFKLSSPRQEDNDDDGETAAGSRLAHLLSLLEVDNVIVVVTRWYGGVHLGSDRFKLINNAARDALEAAGMIAPPKSASKKGS